MSTIKTLNKTANSVLRVLENNLDHSNAQEILEYLNATSDRKVSLTSVYRALNTLVELCLIKPLNFNDGHIRYEHAIDDHHHHFICTSCKNVKDIDLCPLENKEYSLLDKCTIEYHSFELFGTCERCSTKNGKL